MLASKKVAIIYRMDHPGGVQSVVTALIRGLNQQGIIPDILWDLPPNRELLEAANCKTGFQKLRFHISTRRIDKLPSSLRYVAWIFNCTDLEKIEQSYDFYFLFHNSFLVSTGMQHLRYLNGPPLIPQLWVIPKGLRGLPVRFFGWSYRNFLRFKYPVYEFHRDSPYVINSQYTSDLFEQTHGVRLPVVYPPIQMVRCDYAANDLPQRNTITFFSRIVDYKRPEMVLELAKRYPQQRCVIMGGVPSHRIPFFESLKLKAKEAELEHVFFYANPSDVVVREELSRTRFYIFPAKNEHFGMTTVEAVACGAIPFVHDSGGQREIVHIDKLRFTDADYFEKFAWLFNQPLETLNQIRSGLAQHILQFSEEKSVEKLLAYLNDK